MAAGLSPVVGNAHHGQAESSRMKPAAWITSLQIRLLPETPTAVCCCNDKLLGAGDPGDSLEIAPVSWKTSAVLVAAAAADVTG